MASLTKTGNLPITDLLNRAHLGDQEAAAQVWEAVYQDIHLIARKATGRQQKVAWNIEATALVNEFFIRLELGKVAKWDNRAHFFGSAAKAMEQLLVDYFRASQRIKRGGGKKRVSLDDCLEIASKNLPQPNTRMGRLVEATRSLEKISPRAATVTRMRYALGFKTAEISEILDISERTVRSDWSFAKAFLRRELDEDSE